MDLVKLISSLWKKNSPPKKVRYMGIFFDSKSEAACAVLLEKYIPNFKIIRGSTYQVPSGHFSIDFLVQETFVEYHPIVLTYGRDIKKIEDYLTFKKTREQLPPRLRQEYIKMMKEQLASDYYHKRKSSLDYNHLGYDFILAKTPLEFYDSVIKPFGRNYPSKKHFREEFKSIVHLI